MQFTVNLSVISLKIPTGIRSPLMDLYKTFLLSDHASKYVGGNDWRNVCATMNHNRKNNSKNPKTVKTNRKLT